MAESPCLSGQPGKGTRKTLSHKPLVYIGRITAFRIQVFSQLSIPRAQTPLLPAHAKPLPDCASCFNEPTRHQLLSLSYTRRALSYTALEKLPPPRPQADHGKDSTSVRVLWLGHTRGSGWTVEFRPRRPCTARGSRDGIAYTCRNFASRTLRGRRHQPGRGSTARRLVQPQATGAACGGVALVRAVVIGRTLLVASSATRRMTRVAQHS